MLKDLIKYFSENNSDKYYFYENYSGTEGSDRKYLGIVVRERYSYMQMLMELTSYLEENDFEDVHFELENLAVEDFGQDVIVYFPNLSV